MVGATFHGQILLLSMQLHKSSDCNSDDDNASHSNAENNDRYPCEVAPIPTQFSQSLVA
jgi:hypothetical protein